MSPLTRSKILPTEKPDDAFLSNGARARLNGEILKRERRTHWLAMR